MRNILWVSDEPNWAYDANAKALARYMSQHNHHFIYTVQKGKEAVDLIKDDMDIIVAMNPAGFYMYDEFNKVISILDTVRALNKSNEDKLSEVAGIICNNSFLYECYRNKNKNIILQPNGVDLAYFEPNENYPNRKFTVGFAGNIAGSYADYKGWNFYRRAVQLLKVEMLNAVYDISQIAPDRMVPDFYHKIDCLILPSLNEGCSNVITEALACGVPVICTKVGYHGEYLQSQEECLFVERTVESVKSAIMELKDNTELLSYMRGQARIFACKNHNIESVAQKYAEFFEGIL